MKADRSGMSSAQSKAKALAPKRPRSSPSKARRK